MSSLCHATSLMTAHDLNVGVDIDFDTKVAFLNYAKDYFHLENGKPYIEKNGYVNATALEFTSAYAEFTNTKLPTGYGSLGKNGIGAQYGVGIAPIYNEFGKQTGTHSVTMNFYNNSVTWNPWTAADNWSHGWIYTPDTRLVY